MGAGPLLLERGFAHLNGVIRDCITLLAVPVHPGSAALLIPEARAVGVLVLQAHDVK